MSQRRPWDPEPTAERAAIELRMDLKRIRNDVKSALARWPFSAELHQIARQVGVK